MRYLISILGLLLVIGSLSATKYSQISKLIGFGAEMKASGPPPETVATDRVQQQSWTASVGAIGSVVASKGVTLSNDAPGIVSRIYFDSGAKVTQGQVLVELDSTVERAQVASLRTKVRLAHTSLARTQALVKSGAISEAQLDTDDAIHKGLEADERAVLAQIGRKTIKAPFSGKLGLRSINLGQYLAPGTPIAVLESTKAVYIDFSVPQARIRELRVTTPILAFIEDSSEPIAKGAISAIEPNVDIATRSVRIRASVDGSDHELYPGMYLRIQAVDPTQRQVIAIPSTAVVHASYGDSVFCVEEATTAKKSSSKQKIARQKFVKLGEVRGDYVAVMDGLTAGEEVVTAGAFKLRNGVPLVVNNDVRLEPKLSPTPTNR